MSRWLRLSREILFYGIVGVGQLGIDWLTFVLLSRLGLPVAVANVAGRVCGAVAGFWLNGRWTFSKKTGPALGLRQFLRFAASWVVMTVLSTLVVMMVDRSHGLHWTWVAKPFADAILAGLGFLVSKFWIYRHPPVLDH